MGVGTWKEKPENEYEEGFEVLTRVNPLLYQLNSDNFLNQLPGASIIWDMNEDTGDKWPKLCVENFNNLKNIEIHVREIELKKNDKGQDSYLIKWVKV